MYDNTIDSKWFCERFEKALEIKYPDEAACHRRGIFVKDYDLNSNDEKSIKSKIDGWYSAKGTLPKLEVLRKICNILDCDISFFFTDTEVLNESVYEISKTTGFSEKALFNLRKMNTDTFLVLDILLENGEMENILQAIYEMNVAHSNVSIIDSTTGATMNRSISREVINYSYATDIIKYSKSINKCEKYLKYNKEKFINNRGKIPIQLPVKIDKQLETDIKKEKLTFNEACDKELNIP